MIWTLDVRRSRCSASHSEVYDALQVLGLGSCALKLDDLMSTIERYGKYDFLDKDPPWLVVEEIPVCQFAGRSNCLGKSVGNLLARRTGCWFCQLLSFLENYNKRPWLPGYLQPGAILPCIEVSGLKKGVIQSPLGPLGFPEKNASCDLWHYAECAFPCCLLALEVRWCLGSHWHSNGSREAMPAKPISSTVPKIFLRFMIFKGFLTISNPAFTLTWKAYNQFLPHFDLPLGSMLWGFLHLTTVCPV